MQRSDLIQFAERGYAVLPGIYSPREVSNLGETIAQARDRASGDQQNFVASKDLVAIREVLQSISGLKSQVLTQDLKSILQAIFPGPFFLSKAIYFDKPANSNWFVAYHQDLTLSLREKIETPGFSNWTHKRGQIGVQPPVAYLEQTTTVRIHLDDTDESNGALRVIPDSHQAGILRKEELPEDHQEDVCNVPAGGVMLMKPLLFHASRRSKGTRNRRVIHLEFCDQNLPPHLEWKEKVLFPQA